jgi:hypothetical protein
MLTSPRWLSTLEFAEAAGMSPQAARKAIRLGLDGKLWRGRQLKVRRAIGPGGRSGLAYEVALESLPPGLNALPDRTEAADEAQRQDHCRASHQDRRVLERLEIIETALNAPPSASSQPGCSPAFHLVGDG